MVVVEMRNGFGIDLEVAESRPVGLTLEEGEEPVLGFFEGWVLLIPFFSILWGDIYTDLE